MNRLTKLFILLFLCFCFFIGVAQESPKQHIVGSGETIGSIAKKYQVTPYELQQANPGVLKGVKANDILVIPQSKIKTVQVKSISDSIRTSAKIEPTEYTVKRGDTKFSLSRRFGLTIKGLESRNPHIVPILQEGQILSVTNNTQEKASINLDTYVVRNVDTKFGLAKKFNTSISKLEQENPHIVKLLQAGQTIRIPSDEASKSENKSQTEAQINTQKTPIKNIEKEKKSNVAIVPKTKKQENTSKEQLQTQASFTEVSNETPLKDNPDTNHLYTSYEVQPNETLSGLANKSGMPIPEFLILNPQLKETVQSGTLIKMPKNFDEDESTIIASEDTNLSVSLNTSKTKKILFILPFSEIGYHKYDTKDNFDKVSDDFIKTHLEFYKGASIAIDSIRKLRLNVEVEIVEALNKIDNTNLMALVKARNMTSFDGVILPYYGAVDSELAKVMAADNIPVITAANIVGQNRSKNLYSAFPSVNLQRKKILDHIRTKKGHIVVISDVNRDESRTFIAEHSPKATFIDLNSNGTFNNDDLIGKFKKDQVNYVILDSERNSVFINTTNVLLSQLSNYTIQIAILEADLIPDRDDVSKKRYQILKMLFPSFTPAETSADTKHFAEAYQKKYNRVPSTGVLLGFDITFDTLLRLAQPQSFQNTAENRITEYTQLKFDYEKNNMGGYDNQGIYILQYNTGSDIKKIN